MPSASSAITTDDRLVAGYAALAVAIHVLEAGFPSPIPGIKPGLANVVTLIALLRHSLSAAVWVATLRVIVGSLLVGSFLSPAFWLSAAGAAASLAALAGATGWNRIWRGAHPAALGAVGLAVISALAHMGGQFLVAYGWFVPHRGLLTLLPLLMAAALLFGLISGWAATEIMRRLPPRSAAA